MESQDRIAVLIDAENISNRYIKLIIDEITAIGVPTYKRVYGDFSNKSVNAWQDELRSYALTPVFQFNYTKGKNASDSAIIIDAMDILYSGNVDGFVLVSSDSDFTRLAVRLREAGMLVIGIGEKKTPSPFIVACNKFIYIEVIRSRNAPEPAPAKSEKKPAGSTTRKRTESKAAKKEPEQKPQPEPKPEKKQIPDDIIKLIADSVADLTEDEDGVFMGELGTLLIKKQPDFDCRNFGFRSLTAMIKSIDRFGVELRQTSDPHIKHPYVRDKESAE